MIKIIALLKRRPGMSKEDFRSYYEGRHAMIGKAAFTGRGARYVRRYLQPFGHPNENDGRAAESDVDVVMEMWFDDRKTMEDAMALFQNTPLGAFVVNDEAKLFDRDKIRLFIADEEETDLSGPALSVPEIEMRLGIE